MPISGPRIDGTVNTKSKAAPSLTAPPKSTTGANRKGRGSAPLTGSQISAAASSYGGGSGSFSGGGGGGTSAPTALPSTTSGGTPVETDENYVQKFQKDLDALTEDQIEAAMAEIEARYGLTREQLQSEGGAAGRAFRLLETQLGRQRDQALEGAENSALQRGLFNSGIYGQDVAEIQRGYAEGVATGEADFQAKMSAIQQALAGLDAQMTAEQAARAAQIRQDQLQFAASTYGT